MLTLQIDNHEVEHIFIEAFQGNKEKFLAFIQSFSVKKASLEAYEEDRERFMETYKRMNDGSMKMFSQAEAKKEIDDFLETIQPLESFSNVDTREYVDGLRGNSRIIGG